MDLDTFLIQYKHLFQYIPPIKERCGRLYIDFELYKKIFHSVYYRFKDNDEKKLHITKMFIDLCKKHNLSCGDLVITNHMIAFMFLSKKETQYGEPQYKLIVPTYGIHPDVAVFNGLGKLQTSFPLDYWNY